eukprot:3771017-Amphidinium_carterae.1
MESKVVERQPGRQRKTAEPISRKNVVEVACSIWDGTRKSGAKKHPNCGAPIHSKLIGFWARAAKQRRERNTV